jgi:hypothetical protein
MILTIRRTGPFDAMNMMGWPNEKIDLAQQVATTGIWTSIAFGIAHLLFLLWLGRYFRRAKPV